MGYRVYLGLVPAGYSNPLRANLSFAGAKVTPDLLSTLTMKVVRTDGTVLRTADVKGNLDANGVLTVELLPGDTTIASAGVMAEAHTAEIFGVFSNPAGRSTVWAFDFTCRRVLPQAAS